MYAYMITLLTHLNSQENPRNYRYISQEVVNIVLGREVGRELREGPFHL